MLLEALLTEQYNLKVDLKNTNHSNNHINYSSRTDNGLCFFVLTQTELCKFVCKQQQPYSELTTHKNIYCQ